MELMGEEFPYVRKRVADKVLRDNKMGGELHRKVLSAAEAGIFICRYKI